MLDPLLKKHIKNEDIQIFGMGKRVFSIIKFYFNVLTL